MACVGSSFDTQIAPFEPSASFDFKVDSSAKSRPAGGGGGGGRRSSKGNERPADTASATESSADSGVGIRTRSMAKQGSTSSGCGCSSSRSSKSKKKEAQTSASGGDDSTEESLDSLYGDISGGKVREYKEAFAMLDENCDGLISAGEIKSMFGRIGQPVTDEEVTAMLREIDLDGNQYIDFDEFMQMMLKYESRITPEQYEMSLRRVFEIFDLDKNSFITQTELKQVMAKLGKLSFPCPTFLSYIVRQVRSSVGSIKKTFVRFVRHEVRLEVRFLDCLFRPASFARYSLSGASCRVCSSFPVRRPCKNISRH